MNRTTIALLCLLAGGCALPTTPAELMRLGDRHTFTLQLAPKQAAQCMGRNAEERTPLARPVAQVRDGATAGSYEVHVRAEPDLIALAIIEPAGTGSRAVVYRVPRFITTGSLPERMAFGC